VTTADRPAPQIPLTAHRVTLRDRSAHRPLSRISGFKESEAAGAGRRDMRLADTMATLLAACPACPLVRMQAEGEEIRVSPGAGIVTPRHTKFPHRAPASPAAPRLSPVEPSSLPPSDGKEGEGGREGGTRCPPPGAAAYYCPSGTARPAEGPRPRARKAASARLGRGITRQSTALDKAGQGACTPWAQHTALVEV
jgi:hypothetical protein